MKRTSCLAFMALMLLGSAPAAFAATPAEASANSGNIAGMPTGLGGSGPLEISAQQSMEYHENELLYIARGAVEAKRGDVTLFTDELAAHERMSKKNKKDVFKLTASGAVRITSQDYAITGDEGVYFVDEQAARLTGGNLTFSAPDTKVTAKDSLEYFVEKKMAVANGQAVATREDKKVLADKLVAEFMENTNGALDLSRISAIGNVTIITPTDVARGAKAIYDMKNNKALLTGNVRITRGASQLQGAAAEVDFKTGLSRLNGNNSATAQNAKDKDGRVRVLFVPGENDDAVPFAKAKSP